MPAYLAPGSWDRWPFVDAKQGRLPLGSEIISSGVVIILAFQYETHTPFLAIKLIKRSVSVWQISTERAADYAIETEKKTYATSPLGLCTSGLLAGDYTPNAECRLLWSWQTQIRSYDVETLHPRTSDLPGATNRWPNDLRIRVRGQGPVPTDDQNRWWIIYHAASGASRCEMADDRV